MGQLKKLLKSGSTAANLLNVAEVWREPVPIFREGWEGEASYKLNWLASRFSSISADLAAKFKFTNR